LIQERFTEGEGGEGGKEGEGGQTRLEEEERKRATL